MKFLQDRASLDCLQFPGQAMRTVLCFIPPSPADWMRWEKPSLRLEDTTTWQKPLVRSAAMEVLMFWTQRHAQARLQGSPAQSHHISTYIKDLRLR